MNRFDTITRNDLELAFLKAVKERDALNAGTLTEEETAGYWIRVAAHDAKREFVRMLKMNDIYLSENAFYAEVNEYLGATCS